MSRELPERLIVNCSKYVAVLRKVGLAWLGYSGYYVKFVYAKLVSYASLWVVVEYCLLLSEDNLLPIFSTH